MTVPGQPRLPGDRSHLQRLIATEAKQTGVPENRLQRWLSAMVVAAMLDRVRDENDEPIFLLKGGVAMELRLRLKARTTSDYDATFRARADEVLTLLDQALQQTYNNFSITREAPEKIGQTGAIRMRLRLAYKGREWSSVKFELAPAEGNLGTELDRVEAVPVDGLQVPILQRVSCVSVRYQVAQKIHACTEVFPSGSNERFRDVMDILLIEDLIRNTVGLAAAREACLDIFGVRSKHAWPPTLTIYESWPEPFRKLADDNNFQPNDVVEAGGRLRLLIADIESGT